MQLLWPLQIMRCVSFTSLPLFVTHHIFLPTAIMPSDSESTALPTSRRNEIDEVMRALKNNDPKFVFQLFSACDAYSLHIQGWGFKAIPQCRALDITCHQSFCKPYIRIFYSYARSWCRGWRCKSVIWNVSICVLFQSFVYWKYL